MSIREKKQVSLTEGSVAWGLLAFAAPLLLGQLLQQLYNLADAWVIGNFASNDSFAAVSSGGSLTFLVIGFFNGVAIGGGVIISKYFGARDAAQVSVAVHNNFLFGLIASAAATAFGLVLAPHMLVWMETPAEVLPYSLAYFRVYFGGVSTVIMYNICMAIMRAQGDSLHPLYYLILSSVVNVVLDLLFVAVWHWDVTGAAVATVIAQGLSALLCILRMMRQGEGCRLEMRKLRPDLRMMREILIQGVPTGIQNSVISIGNIVIQTNINAFGAFAMSGHGAYSKIEGFAFLPITCMSMAPPTFIGQNLGAKEYGRARRGALFGCLCGMVTAEAVALVLYLAAPQALGIFTDAPEALAFGLTDIHTIAPFYCLLAFSHCAAGVMRGCGKSIVPMLTMLSFWCAFRILYVTAAVHFFLVFQSISWAYPITWTCSSVVFFIYLVFTDWPHAFERRRGPALP